MIGRFLAGLNDVERNRVLTQPMQPNAFVHHDGSRCLLATAGDGRLVAKDDGTPVLGADDTKGYFAPWEAEYGPDQYERRVNDTANLHPEGDVLISSRVCALQRQLYRKFPLNSRGEFGHSVEWRYDLLCSRYGTERVNTWIRNKLLFGKGPSLSYRVIATRVLEAV